MSKPNPRRANGYRRDKAREWVLRTQDVCAICGRAVDKSLKTPHPMSPEVDEIVPVSKGGSPYDRENLQLTHRRCNRLKSNRMPSSPIPEKPPAHSRDWGLPPR